MDHHIQFQQNKNCTLLHIVVHEAQFCFSLKISWMRLNRKMMQKKRHSCRATKRDRPHWLNCFICDGRDLTVCALWCNGLLSRFSVGFFLLLSDCWFWSEMWYCNWFKSVQWIDATVHFFFTAFEIDRTQYKHIHTFTFIVVSALKSILMAFVCDQINVLLYELWNIA